MLTNMFDRDQRTKMQTSNSTTELTSIYCIMQMKEKNPETLQNVPGNERRIKHVTPVPYKTAVLLIVIIMNKKKP